VIIRESRDKYLRSNLPGFVVLGLNLSIFLAEGWN